MVFEHTFIPLMHRPVMEINWPVDYHPLAALFPSSHFDHWLANKPSFCWSKQEKQHLNWNFFIYICGEFPRHLVVENARDCLPFSTPRQTEMHKMCPCARDSHAYVSVIFHDFGSALKNKLGQVFDLHIFYCKRNCLDIYLNIINNMRVFFFIKKIRHKH